MSKRQERFEVGPRPGIELATFSGDIVVTEGPDGVIEVLLNGAPDKFTIEQRGDTIVVQPEGSRRFARATDITAKVPPGTAAQLKCTSGDLLVEVPLSRLDAAVASGDVRARAITGDATIKSASGDTAIDNVDGRLEINTASGDARIGHVGFELTMNTASGDARVDSVDGPVRLRTASGDVRIRRFDGGDLTAKTLAGDLTVGIPKRRRIDLDLQSLSGSLRNRLPEGDGSPPEKTITLSIKSVSGDVTLTGA
jgi:DUF4097 and DUF4098 domain-containing protein YvlB